MPPSARWRCGKISQTREHGTKESGTPKFFSVYAIIILEHLEKILEYGAHNYILNIIPHNMAAILGDESGALVLCSVSNRFA